MRLLTDGIDKYRCQAQLAEADRGFCSAYEVAEAELASPRRTRRHARIRAEIARTAQEQGIATIHEIAPRFNRTDTAISHGISRLRRR